MEWIEVADDPLQALPSGQRAVFVLVDALDWPPADVAELLGISLASVKRDLDEARIAIDAPSER